MRIPFVFIVVVHTKYPPEFSVPIKNIMSSINYIIYENTTFNMEREVLYDTAGCVTGIFGRLVFERRERWPPSERGLLFSTG